MYLVACIFEIRIIIILRITRVFEVTHSWTYNARDGKIRIC